MQSTFWIQRHSTEIFTAARIYEYIRYSYSSCCLLPPLGVHMTRTWQADGNSRWQGFSKVEFPLGLLQNMQLYQSGVKSVDDLRYRWLQYVREKSIKDVL